MNKLFLTLALSSGIVFSGYANLNGAGYYRVKNYGSARWANLIDKKAEVDFLAGTADLHSLQLTNNTEAILTDPGSIVYISPNGKNYDISAQGISLKSLVDQAMSIAQNGTADGQDLYLLYATYSGVTKYVGDANVLTTQEFGKASINVTNANFRKWFLIPVEASSDNYFAAKPTVSAEGKLYTTLFSSFAYQPYSNGVKAYYISRIGYGMAEMVEITGAVPPGSPVVIQCASEDISDNRMQIVELQDALPSNALTGVYFDYYGSASYSNRVKYDPNTMRVLGKCSDGTLGFITSDIEYIPSNTAYLKVPAGSAPELKCVSPEVYESNLPEAPESFNLNGTYYLLPQGEDNYTGTFDIPAQPDNSDLLLRFYATGSDSDNFIGAYDASGNNISLQTTGNATLPFSYGSPYYWVLPNWEGGTLQVVINLQNQYVSFNSKMTAVESIYTGNNKIVYDGSSIYCESAKSINLYNTSGQVVASSNTNRLNLAGIPKGVYIATANGQSIKITL